MADRKRKATVVKVQWADDNHRVATVKGGGNNHRRRPCADCPWRVDAVGTFPAEAFRLSASTGYDVPDVIMRGLSPTVFSCHQSGAEKPLLQI